MKIVLASRNPKKIKELRTLLSENIPDIAVLSLDDVGIYDEIEENGTTFAENALIKARKASESGYIGVGDDSGLSVDALNGEPGIYSARYAFTKTGKDDHNDEANNRVLLERLQGVPFEKRTARFVASVACVHPDGRILQTEGTLEGYIAEEKQGENGFGYDPLLFYPAKNCTTACLSYEEKNEISHRGKAIRKLAELLKGWDEDGN